MFKKKDALFVLSEIPTGQKEILKPVPLSTVKNADTLLSYYTSSYALFLSKVF
jgi:hypothetical protein